MKDVKSELQGLTNLSKEIDILEIEKLILVRKLTLNWSDIVGPVLASHSSIKEIKSSSIVIETSHSAYSQELHFQSKRILEFIKTISKFQHISEVKFVLGKQPNRPIQSPPKKQGSLQGKEEIVNSLEQIQDPELKQKLLKIVEVMD